MLWVHVVQTEIKHWSGPDAVLLLLGNNALNFNQVKTPEHDRG